MSAGTISLILNIVLLAFLLFGFLAGLVRGAKKSGIRTIWLVIFLVAVFLLSPIISQSLMGLYIGPLGGTIGEFLEEQILAIPEISDLYNSNTAMQELVLKLPPMILNLVVVMLLVLVAWLISSICYLITKAVIKRKAKKKAQSNKVYTVMNGRPVVIEKAEKPKKYRLLGGLIGAVGGLVMCFCLFLPVTGTVRTVMQYIDTPEAQVASAEDGQNDFQYAELSKKLTEMMGEEVVGYLDALNNSVLVKITSLGNLDLAIYDTISTVNIGGQKVCLRSEVNAVATAYETVLYVETLTNEDGEIDFQSLDFAKLENAVNAIFNSGLVKSFGISTVESIIDDAVSGNLLTTLVDEEKISEDIAGYAKEILTQIDISITQNGGLSNTLKNDLLAILDLAEAVCKSGLLQVVSEAQEFNKDVMLDVASCLKGTHELSQVQEHDYLHDITENLFSSTILRSSLVGAVNIGTDFLKTTIENILTEQGEDITGENAVVFSKAVQTAVDWTKVATAFETIFASVLDAKNMLAEFAFTVETYVEDILKHEDFQTVLGSAGKLLDTIKTLPLLTSTEDNASIFNQAVDAFNRVDYVNRYVDLAMLKTISFEEEFTPLVELMNFAKPILEAENPKTFAYKNLDFTALNENQTFANLFGGKLVEAVKTDSFKTEILDKGLSENVEKYVSTLLENTENFADLQNTALAITNALQSLVKAGAVEFAIDEEKTATDVNLLVSKLLVTEIGQSNMRIQTVIENLFSDDKVAKIYMQFINDFVEGQNLDIGQMQIPQTFETFKAQTTTDLNIALPLLMAVYLDLNITDFEDVQLEEDGIMAIFDILLTENFAGPTGNALKLGTAVDVLTNSVALNTTLGAETKNILREILYKNLEDAEFIDREIILTTTDQNFWKNELTALAPTLMLLHTTYADSTEAQTLLEVLVNDGANALTETDGFKALTDSQIETTVYAICESKLLRPVAIDLLESLATTLGQIFDEEFECTLADNVDLVGQKSQIANVILKALALSETDIEDYSSPADAVLESEEVPNALKNLLIALNSNQSGVFGGVYTLVFDLVETTISDANIAMINLVDSTYEEALEISFDALIEQFDALLDIMSKAKTVADLGADNFDALLETDGATEAILDLLTALDQNKTGAFGTAQEKIFGYFADIIDTASGEIISLVDDAYEGNIEVSNTQILAQFNSILDILKKADAVKDLGADSIETLLDTDGADAKLENLLSAMQESASGVFGTAYNAIFEYMQTTYGEVLEALTNATSQTVVWADVLAEYQEYKTLLP